MARRRDRQRELRRRVSYGLNDFRNRIPSKPTDEYFPKSTMSGSEGDWAVIDSIRFPNLPEENTSAETSHLPRDTPCRRGRCDVSAGGGRAQRTVNVVSSACTFEPSWALSSYTVTV